MANIIIKTKSQIEEEMILESIMPSRKEIQKAELQIEILNILLEVQNDTN